MTFREFWGYCRYSTFQLVTNLNPIHWFMLPLYFKPFTVKMPPSSQYDDEYENTEVVLSRGFHLKVFMFRLSVTIESDPSYREG